MDERSEHQENTDKKSVFLSYRRRVSSFVARSVYQDLVQSGYDVFMDVENIDAGHFETVILNELGVRPHFIAILEKESVFGWADPSDWFRREIERAIELERNVIPLLVNGFNFTDLSSHLVGKLITLPQFQGLDVFHQYFDDAMTKLKERFLTEPTRQELRIRTAEEWFQKGGELGRQDKFEEAEAAYTKSIGMNRAMPESFCNRSVMRFQLGDFKGALADLDQAIALDPTSWQLYKNRGDIKQHMGDLKGAIRDYSLGFNSGEEPEPDPWLNGG